MKYSFFLLLTIPAFSDIFLVCVFLDYSTNDKALIPIP